MQDPTTAPPTVRTDDVDQAAFLLSEGARLIAVEPSASGFSMFAIAGAHAEELTDRYVRGGVTVDLDRFLAARRLLLDRIARVRRLGRPADDGGRR